VSARQRSIETFFYFGDCSAVWIIGVCPGLPKDRSPAGIFLHAVQSGKQRHSQVFLPDGGVEGVVVNVTHAFGIQAEFNGYASATRNFCIPAGTICPTGCSGSVQADLFTYNVGPVFKDRTEYFEPFFETMFGGATPMPAPISLNGLRRLLRNLRGGNQQRFRFHYGRRCGHSIEQIHRHPVLGLQAASKIRATFAIRAAFVFRF
jgi:hypothetical protein